MKEDPEALLRRALAAEYDQMLRRSTVRTRVSTLPLRRPTTSGRLVAAVAASLALAVLTTGSFLLISRDIHHGSPARRQVPFPATSFNPSPSPPSTTFGCRLPVVTRPGSGSPASRGWLDVDTGTFTADTTDMPPGPFGGSLEGATYDAEAKRWLPPGAVAISPDGARYTYATPGENVLHVITISTGADRIYNLPSLGVAAGLFPVGFNGSGIYLQETSSAGYVSGLWHLDPDTGAITHISGATTTPPLAVLEDDFAWAIAGGGFDTPPTPTTTFELDQVNLTTGRIESSFTFPAPTFTLSGYSFDGPEIVGSDRSGGVLVQLQGVDASGADEINQFVVISRHGSLTTVYTGSALNHTGAIGEDGHGFWLATDATRPPHGPNDLYLLSNGSLVLVRDLGNQPSYDVVGPCVPKS